MQKLTALLVVSASLVGAASAQVSTKIESPFRVELGYYLPTYSDKDTDGGVQVGLGYSFLNYKGIDFAAVARGTFWSDSGADINVQNYGVDARYRPAKDGGYFVGVGLNSARIEASQGGFSEDTTHLGWAVEAGYDLSGSLYGVVRYNDAFGRVQGAYKGVTFGVGYRF